MWIRGFLPTETFLLQMRTQAVQVIRTCESIHVTVCLQWRPQNWWNNIQGYTANQADWWIKEGAGLTNLLTMYCAHWAHISTGRIARVLDCRRPGYRDVTVHTSACRQGRWFVPMVRTEGTCDLRSLCDLFHVAKCTNLLLITSKYIRNICNIMM
jgi:hypothetical protein